MTSGRAIGNLLWGTQRCLWERNKGSAEGNKDWCEHLCDKGVPGLEFPYLSFSSLWDCVSTGELVTMREATSSGTWKKQKPNTLSVRHKRKFHLNKTSIFKHSLYFNWIKLSLQKVLGSLLGKMPVPAPTKSKEYCRQSTTVPFGTVDGWSWAMIWLVVSLVKKI